MNLGGKTIHILALSNTGTSADPSAEIILRQGSRVVHETFISRQSQRMNDRALINAVAKNNRHINTMPLYILCLEA